jgi:hypothetical protein
VPVVHGVQAGFVAMLFWALLAWGQITLRRVDGWQTLEHSPTDPDLTA